MKRFNLCFLGFGNVGRALVDLLCEKEAELREDHGIEWQITGVSTRTLGWIASKEGLDTDALQSNAYKRHRLPPAAGIGEWLKESNAAVLFETTSLNPLTGQPATDHIRAALEFGAHAITANKGPVLHAYQELSDLAKIRNRKFLFESTVMDCLPVFSLFRETLPATHVLGFRGILNSTTSIVFEGIEKGSSIEEGIKKAQLLGIAETDPSYDIDGWDAAVKVCIIANVLMNSPLKLEQVNVKGIRDLNAEEVRAAKSEGRPFKLVSRATRIGGGSALEVNASVRPEQVAFPDPLAMASGASLVGHFELDVLRGLTVVSHEPNLKSTAYGLLADFINAVREEV